MYCISVLTSPKGGVRLNGGGNCRVRIDAKTYKPEIR